MLDPMVKMMLEQSKSALVDVLRQAQMAAADGKVDRWEIMSIGFAATAAVQPMIAASQRLSSAQLGDVIDILDSVRFE